MPTLFDLSSFTGSLEVTSTEAHRQSVAELRSRPRIFLLASRGTGCFRAGIDYILLPHLAVGASWQTTITYINYSGRR